MANFELQQNMFAVGAMIFERTIQYVGSLLIIVEHVMTADRGDPIRETETQSPASDIQLMNTLIPQIPVAIIPEPMPVIVEVIFGKWLHGSWPGPQIVIDSGRNRR